MAMVSTHEAFDHRDWLFELKWDGFRPLAYCAGEEGKLRSKNNQSFNTKFQHKTRISKLWLNNRNFFIIRATYFLEQNVTHNSLEVIQRPESSGNSPVFLTLC